MHTRVEDRSRRLMRTIVLVASLLASAPLSAANLIDAMKGRTLTCGAGVSFFVDRAGSTIQMIGFGIDPGTGIAEARFALDGETLVASRPDRVEIVVRAEQARQRLRFQSVGGKASMAKTRSSGILLTVDGSRDGDDCTIDTGYPAFVETRFNFIREGLCGNDPVDACIDALRRSCGASPDAACVTRSRPMLKRITREAAQARR